MNVMTEIRVIVTYDQEAEVWCVEESDLPGLNAEAATVEALQAKIERAIVDLVTESGGEGDFEVPIELIAHAVAGSKDVAIA